MDKDVIDILNQKINSLNNEIEKIKQDHEDVKKARDDASTQDPQHGVNLGNVIASAEKIIELNKFKFKI